MNWFRQNRFLGTSLIVFGLATIASAVFVWMAQSRFDAAQARFNENAAELNRYQRMTPFPTEANLAKMKTQAQDYAAALAKLKEDLKTHVLPAPPMAPNEFQARLNQARAAIAEKARANKVKLPENFILGFDEYAAALPDTAAAPLLGQELAQTELLLNILLDARVDAISALRRVPATAATPAPSPARKPPGNTPAALALIGRNVIEVALTASPSSVRRVLNQVASAEQQLYVVRTLHVLNEKEKGPARAGLAGNPAAPATTPAPANAALNFIVGNEHLQTNARIEMLRFNF